MTELTIHQSNVNQINITVPEDMEFINISIPKSKWISIQDVKPKCKCLFYCSYPVLDIGNETGEKSYTMITGIQLRDGEGNFQKWSFDSLVNDLTPLFWMKLPWAPRENESC